ncbi:hypothetical protein GCM10011386_45360 [Parapedobacter defluvii]|uniref:Uncharacterized protein n=1 Tax=Parapedobacter defluvii TaxID=2045106 RepID=A0ABQ1N0Y2_9SPHI|nr:hypothetical protein [Parapedobacter defluvii]GGC48112.1 hypothetical protein GCM10011386_45360 [Parapedobacter defluvii]
MEQFDGDELITINLGKYHYLLECKKRVAKFDFVIRLLEMDDDKLAKKLSEFNVTEHRVNVLKELGIVTIRDLKHFILNNYPSNVDMSAVIFSGLGPSGSRKVLQQCVLGYAFG